MSASRTKRLHAVTIDLSTQVAFERVEDATALIKLLEKSRVYDYRTGQYGKAPVVEYRSESVKPGEPA
jgi:hypothetical protein